MVSILEDMYFFKYEEIGKIEKNSDYEKLIKEASEYYDKLFAALNDEQKKWLDELWLVNGGLESEMGLKAFRVGFRTEFRIVLEMAQEGVFEK